MQSSGWFRYLLSFLRPQVVERLQNDLNPMLEVAYENGRLQLHGATVNYSFGNLQKVFRSAFEHYRVLQRRPARVLILGFGAGSVAQLLLERPYDFELTGVEHDPAVLALGQRYFRLDELLRQLKPELVVEDAVEFVKQESRVWDLVIVDLFVDDTVPTTAQQPSFLEALRGILADKGLLMFNFIADTREKQLAFDQFRELFGVFFPAFEVYKVFGNRVLVVDSAALV